DPAPAPPALVRERPALAAAAALEPAVAPAAEPTPPPARPRLADLRVLGQVDRTYLVAAGAEGLYILDQHAAHERVVFEQLLGRAAGEPAPRQALAVPLTLDLDAAGMERWRRHRERLAAFGFVTEAFGPRTIRVREV